jgi:hypothetical protein
LHPIYLLNDPIKFIRNRIEYIGKKRGNLIKNKTHRERNVRKKEKIERFAKDELKIE